MKPGDKYQDRQIEALHEYFVRVRRNSKNEPSLSDVVISWLTDGPAERFREEYLKSTSIYS
ncbi:MAG TPA: hypothetical protein ENK14_10205 [Caldithrix sp.]|nr:hypothetical protein [Caldithrix sp.]